MTFGESIATSFKKYAEFTGRASRSEYWWWMLFVILAPFILSMFSDIVGGLFSLAVLLPSLAVAARRLHDIDRSGWWQLIGLIPLIGWVLMIYWCVQPGGDSNRFGPAAEGL